MKELILNRITILDINSKKILFFDLSSCPAEEFKKLIEEFYNIIKKQKKKSVRLLIDLTGLDYIPTDVIYINDRMKQVNSFLKCQAYVGLLGFKKVLWHIFKENLTIETKIFEKKDCALKWLAEYL